MCDLLFVLDLVFAQREFCFDKRRFVCQSDLVNLQDARSTCFIGAVGCLQGTGCPPTLQPRVARSVARTRRECLRKKTTLHALME